MVRAQCDHGSGGVSPLETVFVGRAAEMADLVAAVDSAKAGHGRAVFVGGEPGIGKTSLARHASAYAGERGLEVWWCRCRDGEPAPPYWPWIELLRSGDAGCRSLRALRSLHNPARRDRTRAAVVARLRRPARRGSLVAVSAPARRPARRDRAHVDARALPRRRHRPVPPAVALPGRGRARARGPASAAPRTRHGR